VQAAEGIFGITHPLKGGRLLNARFTLDGLTGASPNGAAPSNHIQTFTRPSGRRSLTVDPGKIPLDNTFKDTRLAADGSLTLPLDRLSSAIIGAHLSGEHDYTSIGANLGLTRDFNRRNTTLAASVAASHDIVTPLGGTPTAFGSMPVATGGGGEGEGEGDDGARRPSGPGMGKNVYDAVLSITQVLDRKSILRLNYSLNHTTGYLNDPYKVLSLVQGTEGTEPGEPVDYLYESRPDKRTKHALYAELRRYIGGQTIDVSYRYFWDSWNITSKTIDVFYRIPIKKEHALRPHFRWYRQTQADFYHSYLLQGAALPANASADYRLAPFHAITLGLEYTFPVDRGMYLSLGGEYYHQSGDISPPTGLGALSHYDLFPTMNAAMLRVGFTRNF
jgi:hypothetical protein